MDLDRRGRQRRAHGPPAPAATAALGTLGPGWRRASPRRRGTSFSRKSGRSTRTQLSDADSTARANTNASISRVWPLNDAVAGPHFELVDPHLVPQVQPVGDDSEPLHGAIAEGPADQAPILVAEDAGNQQPERGEAVEQLAGERGPVAVGAEVEGQPDLVDTTQ